MTPRSSTSNNKNSPTPSPSSYATTPTVTSPMNPTGSLISTPWGSPARFTGAPPPKVPCSVPSSNNTPGYPNSLSSVTTPDSFDVLNHALCWFHTERNFQSLLPFNDSQTKHLAWVRTQLWDLYADLKDYKLHPNDETKLEISARFDELCRTKTNFQTLNQALKRLHNKKAKLLLVLERPDIPLHNKLERKRYPRVRHQTQNIRLHPLRGRPACTRYLRQP